MEAQLTMDSVKTLTKALTCLARYSDEMDILALPSSLTLSGTNSSKSAYCRLLLHSAFFSSYSVRTPTSSYRSANTPLEESRSVKARLKTKLLLGILRHRNHQKGGVRSVKLIIREPSQPGSSWAPTQDESSDDEGRRAESRLIVKLFCDHGVVKTHHLNLQYPEELLAPAAMDDDENNSVVEADGRVQKSLLEHMRVGIAKADGQISCDFLATEMIVRTIAEKGDLSTEVKMVGTDLPRYDLKSTPISLSFHIREFAATLALAESLDKTLTMTFTEALAPLILNIEPTKPEPDNWSIQSFIATSGAMDIVRSNGAKRTRANQDGPRAKVARLTKHASPEREPEEPELEVQAEPDMEDDPAEQAHGYDDDMNDDAAAGFASPRAAPPPGASQYPQFRIPQHSHAGPSGTYHATGRASTYRLPDQRTSNTQQASHTQQISHTQPSFYTKPPSFAMPPPPRTQPTSYTQQKGKPQLPPDAISFGGAVSSTRPPVSSERRSRSSEPLFLPESQLSQDSKREAIQATGMEDWTEDDTAAFLAAEDDDTNDDEQQHNAVATNRPVGRDKVSIASLSVEFGRTQRDGHDGKPFHTIFPESVVVDAEDEEDCDDHQFQPTQHTFSLGTNKKFKRFYED